ncbi:uncharacterized protein K460DRAFT_367654 [Cucurbitaria berberidis CBS 394.84]|uniref:Uncharacterized protein n=1 Tax=Cucurbitaria berberidis CBS 394.84 TaxID=1168544 RepID=A0A9P4GCG4_9PLEO|nr:uncharacterized protein K460DRAFT_367654 [Cucurbitaria berberidis CBS 394.84]KAF1842694.1 hypothetical protein K460DRAFT_367654 [Cucurbitaria berberidis CBS 394.84]
MRKSTLRKTTLLSLIGLSSQQSTVTWGEPFTVDISTPAAASTASTENLLPSSSQHLLTHSIAPSATLPSLSVSDSTVISNIQSAVSRDSTFSTGSATSPSSGSTVSTSVSQSGTTTSTPTTQSTRTVTSGSGTGAGAQSTGVAAPVYRRMGVAGALAGAAGVLFV